MGMFLCYFFLIFGRMLQYIFINSISAINCLGRFVSEMIYYVLNGMLNLTN